MRPRISVVVRTVGDPRLAEALASLACQTLRDFEVVLVDARPTADRTSLGPYLDAVGPSLPAPITLRPRRRTRPAALNAGIAAASAPWVAILDEDNLYDPRQLEHYAEALGRSGADLVHCGVHHATYAADGTLVARREVTGPFVLERMAIGNYVYTTGSSFRRQLWLDLGGYDERFEVFEDWDFLLRAGGRARIESLPFAAGESRKFTGRDGVSHFDLDRSAVSRCHAGIYWKHRQLYHGPRRRELRLAWAEHCRRRTPPRRGLLCRNLAGWRLEFGYDLATWWIRNAWQTPRPDSRRTPISPTRPGRA